MKTKVLQHYKNQFYHILFQKLVDLYNQEEDSKTIAPTSMDHASNSTKEKEPLLVMDNVDPIHNG
jgi:hypothetical protein